MYVVSLKKKSTTINKFPIPLNRRGIAHWLGQVSIVADTPPSPQRKKGREKKEKEKKQYFLLAI